MLMTGLGGRLGSSAGRLPFLIVFYSPDDTIGDLKKLISAHTGTRADKIRLQRGLSVYKDHISLADYEIHHGSSIDMYYN